MKLTRSRPPIFCVNLIVTFLATLLMNWLIISTILLLTLRCSIFPCIACGFFRQIKAKSVLGFNKWPSIKHYSHSFDFDCQRWHVTKTFELIADYLQLDTRGLDAYDLAVPGPIMQGGGAVSGVAKRKSGGD